MAIHTQALPLSRRLHKIFFLVLKFINCENLLQIHPQVCELPCRWTQKRKVAIAYYPHCWEIATVIIMWISSHSLVQRPIFQNKLVSWYQNVEPFWILLQPEMTEAATVTTGSERRANNQSDRHQHTNTVFTDQPVTQPTVSASTERRITVPEFDRL